MKEINGIKIEIIENERNAFDEEEFALLFTDYFHNYDYVVGDIAYSRLRLKGFYENTSKKVTSINNISNLKDYLENHCAYKCKYFIVKLIK